MRYGFQSVPAISHYEVTTVTNFLLERLWGLTLSLFYSSQIGGVNRSEQKRLQWETQTHPEKTLLHVG